jgi:hypothetical protein
MMAELLDPIIQTTVTSLPEHRVIGNPEGIRLLEEARECKLRLERVERRNKRHERRNERYKRTVQQCERTIQQCERTIQQRERTIQQHERRIKSLSTIVNAIRISVLDKWSRYKSEEAEALRQERNSMVHGGNVMEDYRLLSDMMTVVESDRYDAWKRAFNNRYGAQYLTCVDRQLELAPKRIHKVMDIVANVKSLWTWTKTKDPDRKRDGGDIVDKGRSIIQQWTEWMVPMERLFVKGSDTLALYNQVRELYSKY